jgi:hypothetical protein
MNQMEETMILSLIGMMFACSGDKTDTGADMVANSCPDGAEITISNTYPTSDASNFYVLDSVEFTLSAEDPAATLSLAGPDGDVAGSSSVDGTKVTFAPDEALAPSTAYTASLVYCNADIDSTPEVETQVDIAFQTSALGETLDVDLVGKTYAVDLASGNFIQPPGIGSLLGGLFTNNILLNVTAAGETLEFLGALSLESSTEQDMCAETFSDFPAADFSSSPMFSIPEADVTLNVSGFSATIYSLSVSGTFAADGSYFGGGELSGELDARQLVDIVGGLMDGIESADDVCGLVAGFGVSCTECVSDGEPYCVTLEVDRMTANETGATLMPVTADDIAANADCE